MQTINANTGANKSDECVELKNIKYKTMLLSGNVINEIKSSNHDLTSLEKFLEDDKQNNKNEPWSKLDKTIKTKKLLSFAEKYIKEKNFGEEEEKMLVTFLKDCLDRKKLQRVKDVDYDKISGEIKDVPALSYNKSTKHFTLKNLDKQRISTLKSLPPKKGATRGTVKNTKPEDSSDEDKDEN
jgi:hypothetical protein